MKPDINFCNFEELLRLLKFKFIFPGLRNCLNFTNKTEMIINLDQQIKNFDRKSETYPLFSLFLIVSLEMEIKRTLNSLYMYLQFRECTIN